MRRPFILLLFVAACVLLGGCTPHTDYLAPLRGDFEADISGEINGVEFFALCAVQTGENGEKTVTLTFYAPDALADTVIKRGGDGEITLSAGEVTVTDPHGGAAPLFDLLCPTHEVLQASLDGEGHTKVTGDGFCVTLLADGTPYLLEGYGARITVIRFAAA